jgi:hypothetical protein
MVTVSMELVCTAAWMRAYSSSADDTSGPMASCGGGGETEHKGDRAEHAQKTAAMVSFWLTAQPMRHGQ